MTTFTHHCRAIAEADWPTILRIQSEVYYDLTPESEAVMRSKAIRGPSTSFVAVDHNSLIVAYCLAHPYPADRTAVLGVIDTSPSTQTNNLYLHDLAVQKTSAGCGLAKAMFNHLTTVARASDYRTLSLVAVQQAVGFWTKMGFTPSPHVTISDSYTGDATFMTRDL